MLRQHIGLASRAAARRLLCQRIGRLSGRWELVRHGDADGGRACRAQTRCLVEQGGMPVATRKHDSRERWIRWGAALSSGRRFAVKTALGSCLQKPRRMRHLYGAAGRPCDRARRPRISLSFLAHSGDVVASAVRWRELKGRSPVWAERRFATWPVGHDGRGSRLPDCFRTPPRSSVLARPPSPVPSLSKRRGPR